MSETFLAIQKQTDQDLIRAELKQVLVMQPETVGEVVMLSPALRALKESLPSAETTLITSAAGSQVAPLVPWIDKVMVYPDAWRGINESSLLNLRKDMAFLERMRSQGFSLAMIFTGLSQSPFPAAYACYLAGIPYRVGLTSDQNGSVFSHFLPPPAEDCHQVDRNLKLLEVLDIYDSNNRLELRIPEDVERRANELLIEHGVTRDIPYIVLAPGTSVPSEQYDPHHFAAVAHLLAAQSELQVVIVGNSDEAENIQPVLQVAEQNLYGNVHSLVGKAGIPELAAILRQAALILSNKSSIMYLAETWDCPMIVVYPGTEPIDSWKPRNNSTRFLSRPDSCSICSNTTCPYGMKCLEVRPEEVAVAALEMLADQTYEPARHPVFNGYKSEILSR
jgi:ADP-heptose:LPS heptosyltransferase